MLSAKEKLFELKQHKWSAVTDSRNELLQLKVRDSEIQRFRDSEIQIIRDSDNQRI